MKRLSPQPSKLDHDAFIEAYGGIYEDSPWVAEAVWPQAEAGALDTPGAMQAAMRATVEAAGESAKAALIRAHPELAARAAASGELSGASKEEQSQAGLNALTPEQAARFETLNTHYKERFGFPFIIAVRRLSAEDILTRFEERVNNAPEREFTTAMTEIHKIAQLRLEAMAAGEDDKS